LYPPEVRRVIYTTNLIESVNARLRKVTRNRGQGDVLRSAPMLFRGGVARETRGRSRSPIGRALIDRVTG
jgi:transposase-like protein